MARKNLSTKLFNSREKDCLNFLHGKEVFFQIENGVFVLKLSKQVSGRFNWHCAARWQSSVDRGHSDEADLLIYIVRTVDKLSAPEGHSDEADLLIYIVQSVDSQVYMRDTLMKLHMIY